MHLLCFKFDEPAAHFQFAHLALFKGRLGDVLFRPDSIASSIFCGVLDVRLGISTLTPSRDPVSSMYSRKTAGKLADKMGTLQRGRPFFAALMLRFRCSHTLLVHAAALQETAKRRMSVSTSSTMIA